MNHNCPSFDQIELHESLYANLDTLGYKEMTPIQALSLPVMLTGRDIIAQAKTGSGKTAAFGLTILQSIKTDVYSTQALVLCPTRELADQVAQTLRKLARLMPNVKILNLSGGIPMKPQLDSLRHGAPIIVGTPGRIQKHLQQQTVELSTLKILVLDEADRMLDMGFYEAMINVMRFCPSARQTLLFSATYPDAIKPIAKSFMKEPEHLMVEESPMSTTIEQQFYEVTHSSEKLPLLTRILSHHQHESTLIFCNTKENTALVFQTLAQKGFSVGLLNGDMEQIDRDRAIIRFTNKSCSILVASDVAARGLDIADLPLVINYDLAFESDVHTHRVGRTGRAGANGLAITITTPSDGGRLCALESQIHTSLQWKSNDSLTSALSPLPAKMITLMLNSGRKNKIRAGDIVGALTKDAQIPVQHIGKITITPLYSYVAIHKSKLAEALSYFKTGRLKAKSIVARKLD